jgi:hybrid cluster-associated redox disulfide protein
MNCARLHSQFIVADVLHCWRETIPVFLRHRMACIGCPMAGFETLEGAAAVYGLELEPFLDELQQIIQNTKA